MRKMSQGGFFEFREKLVRAGRPGAQPADPAQAISVSQLTTKIEGALRSGVPASVLVRGELSNVNQHRASGHLYFTLKDDAACIDCVIFRSDAERLKFTPADGADVLARGSVRVFAQRGRYQLYATTLSPLGKGALEVAFQQLKEKLEREGLFAAERKRPLPKFPKNIALVTGRETAALHDVLKVLRRFPFLSVSIYPVLVQGDGAAAQIVNAICSLEKYADRRPDLIVLARGGGSLEDLWSFNEEIVARAIARCAIPVITGIGHEVDVSIADLVADYHAHTPTEAAQVVVAHWRTSVQTIESLAARHVRALRGMVTQSSQRLRLIQQHEIFRRPTDLIDRRRQWIDDLQKSLVGSLAHRAHESRDRLQTLITAFAQQHPRHTLRLSRQRLTQTTLQLSAAAKRAIDRHRQTVLAIETHLKAVSPQATLGRGYSITKKKGGDVVRAAKDVKTGDVLLTRFSDGQTESVVRDQKQMRLFE